MSQNVDDLADIEDVATLNPTEPFSPRLLFGPWVTSHAGLLQMIGTIQGRAFAPPQTAGYDVSYDNVTQEPVGFSQREGYFHTAAVSTYVFDGRGNVKGGMHHVRGGHGQYQQIQLGGTYEVFRETLPTGHHMFLGNIFTVLPIGNWNYHFVMKNPYELEWVWTPPPFRRDQPPADRNRQPRPLIARGTLTKVRNAGVLRRALQRLILG